MLTREEQTKIDTMPLNLIPAADRREAVIYRFNPKTGHIDAVIAGTWHKMHSTLLLPNQLIVDGGHLPAYRTHTDSHGNSHSFDTIVDAGWFLTIKDGKVVTDEEGNILISPPPHHVDNPTSHDYILLGLIRAGHLKPEEIHRDIITDMNHRFDKVGQPIVPGTTLLPHPKHTAVCKTNIRK